MVSIHSVSDIPGEASSGAWWAGSACRAHSCCEGRPLAIWAATVPPSPNTSARSVLTAADRSRCMSCGLVNRPRQRGHTADGAWSSVATLGCCPASSSSTPAGSCSKTRCHHLATGARSPDQRPLMPARIGSVGADAGRRVRPAASAWQRLSPRVSCPPDQQGGACVVGDADGARGQPRLRCPCRTAPCKSSPTDRLTGLGDGQPRHLIRGRCDRAGSPNGAEVACGELPYAKTTAQMPDVT